MADSLTPEQRKKNMAAIKSKNTIPEIYFRKLLFSKGYRYRISDKGIPGHPDVFLRKYNTAVFIHGCYWHRHANCKFAYLPKSNTEFWMSKFEQNLIRDKKVRTVLAEQGVKCIIIWECAIKKMQQSETVRDMVLQKCMDFFESDNLYCEIEPKGIK